MKKQILFLSLILIFSFSLAQESSSLQAQLEQDVATYESLLQERESELNSIEESLGSNAAALNQEIAERNSISQNLSALKSNKLELETSIEALTTQLTITQADLSSLQTDVANLKTHVEGLLIDLYKQRNSAFANALNTSTDFHDLQVKTYYLSLLAEQDLALLEGLSTKANDLAVLQQEHAEQLSSLSGQKESLISNEAELATKQAELDTAIENLESSQEGKLAIKAALLQEQEELERVISSTITQLEQEKARLRREADEKRRQAAAANTDEERDELIAEAVQAETRLAALGTPLPELSSGYIYPIVQPTLASAFGSSGLSGVIMTTDQAGAAVVAIHRGIVTNMAFQSANDGYLVSIQHSETLGSTYINLQELPLVSIGDIVEQGDVIGYLGGGTLMPPNALKFYMARTNPNGSLVAFVNPAEQLGF